MTRTHDLKVWSEYFPAILDGSKSFEVRKDDRGFAVGDILRLREWHPEGHFYSGREVELKVTYYLKGGQWGILEGYCVLGLTNHPI